MLTVVIWHIGPLRSGRSVTVCSDQSMECHWAEFEKPLLKSSRLISAMFLLCCSCCDIQRPIILWKWTFYQMPLWPFQRAGGYEWVIGFVLDAFSVSELKKINDIIKPEAEVKSMATTKHHTTDAVTSSHRVMPAYYKTTTYRYRLAGYPMKQLHHPFEEQKDNYIL